ncbi:3463_t:CDS:1, partial [Cetraspora pellucida]
MENASGSQETSSGVSAGTVVRDEVEKSQEQSLRNSLDRLTIDTLKVVCRGEGLSERGMKKDLVERLADRVLSKAKGKDKVTDNIQVGNIRESRMSFDVKEGLQDSSYKGRSCETFDTVRSGGVDEIGGEGYLDFDQQYVAFEKSMEKTMQAMVGKVVGEIKKSIQPVQNVEENKYWTKEKMNKPRDQFEYDEWCKVGRYLDSALLSNNWDMISKAREAVATRAFMLRIANREGWNIAAEIGDKSTDDLMEVLFHDKLANARQTAKNKRQRVENKPGSPGLALNTPLIGVGQGVQWPLVQQPFQSLQPYQSVQPFHPGFFNSVVPQAPYPMQERQSYDSQRDSWNRPWSSQQSQREYNL